MTAKVNLILSQENKLLAVPDYALVSKDNESYVYKIEGNTLTEILDYGSKVMNQVIHEKTEFKYELLLEKDKFTQIELHENGDRIYSENYIRIE